MVEEEEDVELVRRSGETGGQRRRGFQPGEERLDHYLARYSCSTVSLVALTWAFGQGNTELLSTAVDVMRRRVS